MSKHISLLAAMIFMAWHSFAQSKDSRTEKTFNPHHNWRSYNGCIIITHPDANMEIRLVNKENFELFHNMDSILANCINDLSFFKDSLNGDKRICVDYYCEAAGKGTKIRIKRYAQNGDIFWKKNDDIGKLKMEKDTLNILLEIQPSELQLKNNKISWHYTVSVQIIIDDINELPALMRKGFSYNKAIDSCLNYLSTAWMKDKKINYEHPFTITYNKEKNGKIKVEYFANCIDDSVFGQSANVFNATHKPRTDFLTIGGNVGAGLIQNTISPYAEVGLTICHDYRRGERTFYGNLFTSAYFTFNQQGDQTYIHKNLFANMEFGVNQNKNFYNWSGCNLSLGLGYLYKKEGNYFGDNTFKLFTSIKFKKNGVTLEPSLIMTDNFKRYYPSLTLKIF